MIPALDPDPESDFQHLCNSGSGFGSIKKWNRNTYRCVIIPGLKPDTESDVQLFGNSESGLGSSRS